MRKVTLRNLAAHKLRLVLTALSVILGVAFVAGTLVFTDTVNKTFDEIFSADGDPMVVVRGEKAAEGGGAAETSVPQRLVPELAKVPGVAEARGSVGGYAAVIDADGKVIGGGGPPQLGFNWSEDDDQPLTAGRAPEKPDEVVLDATTAEKAGTRVGGKVKISVAGTVKEATVTGLVKGQQAGATLTFWETSTAQELLLKPGEFSRVILLTAPGVTEEELAARVEAALPGGLEAITGAQQLKEERSEVDEFVSFLQVFLLAFALVSIVVGSFNIFNTFSMLIGQRTRELALLRAVGASRRQVTGAILGEAVAVGAVGATLGLGLGVGLAALLKTVFEAQGMEMRGLVFTATPVIASYLVGVAVTCLAAYFPARRAAKIPPVAAMRDDVALPQRSLRVRAVIGTLMALAGVAFLALGLTGSGGAEQTLSLLGVGVLLVWLAAAVLAAVIGSPVVKALAGWYPKVFGVAGRMARENPRRNPRRTGVTAVALMIGLSLVTTINVITASVGATLERMIDDQFGADYAVSTTNFQGMAPDVVAKVREVPGVTKVIESGNGEFLLDGKNTWYATGDSAPLLEATRARLLSGSADTGPDGVLLSEEEAEKRKVAVGGTLEAVFPDGKRVAMKVAGVYSDNDMLGPIVVSPRLWKAHTARAMPNLLVLETENTGPEIREALDATVKAYPGVIVQDQSDLKEMVRQELDAVVIIFTVMLALSVIIAVFGVVNTIVLSVTERTRELGLLRAVGLSRRQLRRMVRLESVAIALFGGLLSRSTSCSAACSSPWWSASWPPCGPPGGRAAWTC